MINISQLVIHTFFLPHRNENRGVGGIFFDNLNDKPKKELWKFIDELAHKFIDLYRPFLSGRDIPYTPEQRQFQLWRRSRYVEFNLLWDRGTKFGIQSNGRTESILISMPKTVIWKYNYQPPEGTVESLFLKVYLKPQDWVNLTEKDEAELLSECSKK